MNTLYSYHPRNFVNYSKDFKRARSIANRVATELFKKEGVKTKTNRRGFFYMGSDDVILKMKKLSQEGLFIDEILTRFDFPDWWNPQGEIRALIFTGDYEETIKGYLLNKEGFTSQKICNQRKITGQKKLENRTQKNFKTADR